MSEPTRSPEDEAAGSPGKASRPVDNGKRMFFALIVGAVLALMMVAAGLVLPPRGDPAITAPAPTPIDYVPYAATPGD